MKLLNIAIASTALALVALPVKAFDSNTNGVIRDHYKSIIKQQPYQVEVCQDVSIGGDRTHDTLRGAIIGGIIGNNVTKNMPDGGTAGAILGGLLGNMNSDARGGVQRQCSYQTRYNEVQQNDVYSHSTITFTDSNGRQHTLKFRK
jgi:uncharacterized protein YcfJ